MDTLNPNTDVHFNWVCGREDEAMQVEVDAGFNSEGDVEEFVRAVEMSEGFTPLVYEWDADDGLYVITNKFNEI
jgi:hypothetical protein